MIDMPDRSINLRSFCFYRMQLLNFLDTDVVFLYSLSSHVGEDVSLSLALQKNMVLELGQRFTLRDGRITLGTGIITEILPPIEKI